MQECAGEVVAKGYLVTYTTLETTRALQQLEIFTGHKEIAINF